MATETGSPDLIVRTKLFPPRLAVDLVGRRRLLDLMDGAGDRPITLVSAPAGYGKSVLVSQWIDQTERSAAWLSLDEDDSNLGTFLAYFLASLDTAVPGAGHTTAKLLEAPVLPSVATVSDHLVHDLGTLDQPCVLVLDDCHRIDPLSSVHELLDNLLQSPLPGVRFVLITRQDPPLSLKSLRADNQVAEVRLEDLRFIDSETAEFLARITQNNIGEEALRNLQNEVEGWAVGLRLVTLALRGAQDPDAVLRDMSGGISLTREYLMQEVLGSMSEEVRSFLLTSSILYRFCEDLLDALFVSRTDTRGPGGGAHDFLQEIQDANLFVIHLDARNKWFRFHHLFQEMLVQELHRLHGPQEVADLHIRASTWFEGAGLIDEALQYALAAGDMDRAAQIVVRHRQAAVNDDRWYALEKWLALLPESVVQKNAELLMARAWVLMHNVRFEAVLPLADHIETMLEDTADQKHMRGEIALFRGYVLYFLGDAVASLAFMEAALASIPESFFEARAQAEVINALANQMEGRKEQALRGLDELLAAYDSPQEMRKTRLVVTYVLLNCIAGDPEAAEKSNRRLLEIAERGGYAYARTWSVYMQGLIHLQRFELDAALEQLELTVSQRHIHFKRAGVDSIIALMLTQQIQGRNQEARTTLQLLRDHVASLNDAMLWALVGSAEARLAIMAGRVEIAQEWIAASDLPSEGAMLWWLEVPSVTRCRALIAAGSPAEITEAENRLKELTVICEAQHNISHLIETLVLQSVACERQGRRDEACDLCLRALELARPGGIIFPFIEVGPEVAPLLGELVPAGVGDSFVARILALIQDTSGAFRAPESGAAEPVSPTGAAGEQVETLTDREMEVLRLLSMRLQDKEMADRLEISVHTVKHHLKQIYQKLDVHGRRQAVLRAAEIDLVGDQTAE